jgi:hypothetical protein
MPVAFAGAVAAVALIFFAWRQTHSPSAIPVEQPEPAATFAIQDDQHALEERAQREAEQRQREEEARRAEQHRAEEERRRQDEEARRIEARVREYVYEGDVAFLEKRYTTPPDGSAVFAYREALRLDPTNERALDQTAQIIDQYLSWAEAAAGRGQTSRARQHYERAAYVHGEVPAAGDAEVITARLEAMRDTLGIE